MKCWDMLMVYQGKPEGIQESWPTCQRSMRICQKSTWFGSDPLMIERLLLIQSSPNRTWPGCSEWLSSWPATIRVFWTAPAQDHNYLCYPLLKFEGLTQDLRGLMTCRSRWTIGMQRLERLSNLILNKNRDSRDLKCRMRQSRSREKKSCACSSVFSNRILWNGPDTSLKLVRTSPERTKRKDTDTRILYDFQLWIWHSTSSFSFDSL